MASGALPPAFPAVEIDGEYYWDGGLVSNTPLSHVLESRPFKDTLAFQVDLWSARGRVPTNLSEVSDRMKAIQYSSRTRLITDQVRWTQNMRHVLQHMQESLPPEKRGQGPYGKIAEELACGKRYNVVHLIYRGQPYENQYRDFQFGLASMRGTLGQRPERYPGNAAGSSSIWRCPTNFRIHYARRASRTNRAIA